MSRRPHENDENDVSFAMKTQTFENDLQSGKRNSIGVVWTGRADQGWALTGGSTVFRNVLTLRMVLNDRPGFAVDIFQF